MSEVIKSEFIDSDNQELVWPDQIKELMEKKLSKENQFKLVDFIRIITDVMFNRKIRTTRTFPFSEELTEDGIKKEDIAPEISDLIKSDIISQYHLLFTKDVVAKIAGIKEEEISSEQYQAILTSLVKSRDAKEFLLKLGRTEPVVVLPNYRAYKSCALTEKRLLNELRNNKTTCLRINWSDNTTSLLAVKFKDVTIGNCIESTNSNFKSESSYRPIGDTKRWLDEQNKKGEKYLTINLDENDKLSQIWATNRPIKEENFYVAGKHLEDQQIKVKESNNWEEIVRLSRLIEKQEGDFN